MEIKKILGLGALTLWSLIAPAVAKPEVKLDSAVSFIDKPAQEYKMTGQRLGFYDKDLFFGVEQQQEEVAGEHQTRNFFGAMVPVNLEGKFLRAEVMGSQEPEQNTLGVRLRYFFDDKHSLGPIAESVATETGNSTLYGMQGHIEWKGIRTEGGIYQLTTPEEEKMLVNGISNFSALNHRFGLAWRLSEEDQWYGLVFLNTKGDLGYRLKFTYEPTSEKTLQQIILADGLLTESSTYYPFAPREWGESMVDIISEYPSAPMFTAGVPESFLPVYMANNKSVMWATHSADTRKNMENLFIEGAVYPFAYIPSDDFFRGLFIGGTWNQSRAENETDTTAKGYVGFKKGAFRFVVQKEEGSKGETSGYVMYSQQW